MAKATKRTDAHARMLEAAGLRMTKQRMSILDALDGRTEAVTAQDLHHEFRGRPAAPGLATIYRTLAALAQAGVLDTFTKESEQAFRLCGDTHHHHLVCQRCGLVEEVTSEAIETWVARIARRRGFSVTGHSAEVYGVCASCH